MIFEQINTDKHSILVVKDNTTNYFKVLVDEQGNFDVQASLNFADRKQMMKHFRKIVKNHVEKMYKEYNNLHDFFNGVQSDFSRFDNITNIN